VQVGVYVLDLAEIDDRSQTFLADLIVNLLWKDPRLAFDPHSGPSSRVLPLAEVWNPGFFMVNQRRVTVSSPRSVRVEADGSVHYRTRALVTLASPLDLREFPFDQQTLWIRLVSPHRPEELAVTVVPELTGRLPNFSVAGWRVELGEPVVDKLEADGGRRAAARVGFPLLADRRTGYYIWKILIPMAFIVFMAWSVFWISPSQLGPRIGVATASIFTLIAFQIQISGVLPPISYLTQVDEFVVGSSALIFLALGETVLTASLAGQERAELALVIDHHSRWIYLLLFAAMGVVTLFI